MRGFWAALIGAVISQAAFAAEPIEVRVGVVAYQDIEQDFEEFERLFGDLAQAVDRPMQFRLAVGGYGDVLYWLDKQLIDVAILTPGAFAESLRRGREGRPGCRYLASRLLPPGKAPAKGRRERYQSVCLVAEASPLETIDDLRRASQTGRVRFVYVDALSASGHIAPAYALEQAKIQVAPEQAEYSYSHANSLRLLAGTRDPVERVAFVWDGARNEADALPPVRRIPFPELDALDIPADVVVAREGFEQADRVADLLADHVDGAGRHDFARFDDWRRRYETLARWAEAAHVALDRDEGQSISLDELGQMLGQYVRTQAVAGPPRLALVLSGGGAKCAFQIGAVTAIEEKLAELRKATGNDELQISLVAGTSGGAINALAIALGASQTPEGQAELRRAWSRLDQREIVRPSLRIRLNMGLWFIAIESAIVLWLAVRMIREPSLRAWCVIAALAALTLVQMTLSYLSWKPWTWLGENHLLHHGWLWSTFGIEWAGWGLLIIALLAAAGQWHLARSGRTLALPRARTTWALTVALLGLPLAQSLTILFYERTLSDGEGIERRLLQSFSDLAQFRADELGAAPIDRSGDAPISDRLQSVSRQIVERKLLARDLVITGSCLERSNAEGPSDLYFYAPAGADRPGPGYGQRGVSLAERPELLLDVTMGSGSIFPVFPPRAIRDFPGPGESVELVDGGFVHNSPIEAAARWGATHIILVEADPQQRGERRNFLQNAAGAFDHLYYQAQLIDARSREKEPLVIFSLRPEAPHVCMLDFADNLIAAAIEKGYREARGESLEGPASVSGRRTFRKELGQPLFWRPEP